MDYELFNVFNRHRGTIYSTAPPVISTKAAYAT